MPSRRRFMVSSALLLAAPAWPAWAQSEGDMPSFWVKPITQHFFRSAVMPDNSKVRYEERKVRVWAERSLKKLDDLHPQMRSLCITAAGCHRLKKAFAPMSRATKTLFTQPYSPDDLRVDIFLATACSATADNIGTLEELLTLKFRSAPAGRKGISINKMHQRAKAWFAAALVQHGGGAGRTYLLNRLIEYRAAQDKGGIASAMLHDPAKVIVFLYDKALIAQLDKQGEASLTGLMRINGQPLADLRKLVTNPNAQLSHRLHAVRVIGEKGKRSDIRFLEKLKPEPDRKPAKKGPGGLFADQSLDDIKQVLKEAVFVLNCRYAR